MKPERIAGDGDFVTGHTWQPALRNFLPTSLLKASRTLPMFGGIRKYAMGSSPNPPPTMGAVAPTIADHRQDGGNGRQARSIDSRSAIDRFNDGQRAAGTGIEAQPIGESTIRVDGPMAATRFVRWAADHGLAREWKVDDLWYLASEDFAPALGLALPPRRTFLGALKRTPGVTCAPDRRVYDRSGKLIGKRTFYQLPEWPVERTTDDTPPLPALKHAA